ncbi:hypothetical protein [Loktanella sp. S4079]|uniref:hypothetical protein n=1 Tax=Loktanella sp. S4079 TaxID=579483 RepID=UPI0012EE843C|nr:hypothetical protein [Loktanella sp. S4079]
MATPTTLFDCETGTAAAKFICEQMNAHLELTIYVCIGLLIAICFFFSHVRKPGTSNKFPDDSGKNGGYHGGGYGDDRGRDS